MIESFVLIGLLLTPAWFSAIRLAFLQFRGRLKFRSFGVFYLLTFLLTFGGISFLWLVKVPSGIPYGVVLIVGWLLFLFALLADSLPNTRKPDALS